MKNKFLLFALIVLFASCNRSGNFTVSGNITDAAGDTLYFLKNGLTGDSLIDSVALNENGKFKFKVKRSVYPDLYRLKIGDRSLVLGVDSTEDISLQASAKNLLEAKINGSKVSEQIQHFRKSLMALQNQFDKAVANRGEEQSVLVEEFRNSLENHKNEVKALVLSNPLSIASYYALFQQISGEFIFSPYEKGDRPYYQAVATAFTNQMPEYERSKNIYAIVVAALSDSRRASREIDWESVMEADERGFLDIELKNRNGYPKKLSDLEGKTILLDFSAYALENSIDHTFALRELYDKYSDRGLEIYQVSLDQSYNFWAHQSSNIPWTCVHDPDGSSALQYNVTEIPTVFLISKEGTIAGRYQNTRQLEAGLQRIL